MRGIKHHAEATAGYAARLRLFVHIACVLVVCVGAFNLWGAIDGANSFEFVFGSYEIFITIPVWAFGVLLCRAVETLSHIAWSTAGAPKWEPRPEPRIS